MFLLVAGSMSRATTSKVASVRTGSGTGQPKKTSKGGDQMGSPGHRADRSAILLHPASGWAVHSQSAAIAICLPSASKTAISEAARRSSVAYVRILQAKPATRRWIA